MVGLRKGVFHTKEERSGLPGSSFNGLSVERSHIFLFLNIAYSG